MVDKDIEVKIEDYDDEKYCIAYAYNGDENMFIAFGICDFVERMEYWDINVAYGEKNGESGFIFDNKDRYIIKTEMQAFAKEYNLK